MIECRQSRGDRKIKGSGLASSIAHTISKGNELFSLSLFFALTSSLGIWSVKQFEVKTPEWVFSLSYVITGSHKVERGVYCGFRVKKLAKWLRQYT